MQKILTYLLLSSLAVLGACASTTQPDPDGQTHWMTQCDENADCGELSCICGVCTELCTTSDECSIGDAIEASCEDPNSVLDTSDCSLAQAFASVCVPLCDGPSDCSSVASGLTCTSDDVCAFENLPIDEGDGSVSEIVDGGDRDATVDEEDPLPPDAGPVTTIELACDEEGNLEGTGPFEIVASGEIGDFLTFAQDGTIFATATIDGGLNSAVRVIDGEIDDYGFELWELQEMIIHGSDLIAGRSDGYEASIFATDLETQERRTLAREEAMNLTALTADDAAIYWISQLDQEPGRSQVWRSPRVPGETMLLAEIAGYGYDSLVVLDNDLYFFGMTDEGSYELMRIAKDGSSGNAIEAVEVPPTAYGLRSDGQDLIFSVHGEQDDLGNPLPGERGIVRMDDVSNVTQTLFDTGDDQASYVTLGGPYVYWTTDHTVEDFEPIIKLWRGARNGSGEPQQLGTLDSYVFPLAEHNGELYWVSRCRVGNDGTNKSHIVRKTD